MWMAARASGWGFSMACPGGLQACLPRPLSLGADALH